MALEAMKGERTVSELAAEGALRANIFLERLWRSRKYECVHLHAGETGSQARAGNGRGIVFDNHRRPDAAHGGQPPAVGHWDSIETDRQGQ